MICRWEETERRGGVGGANTSSSTQALLMELNFHGEEESFFLERGTEIRRGEWCFLQNGENRQRGVRDYFTWRMWKPLKLRPPEQTAFSTEI